MLTSKILFAYKFFFNIVNLSCNHHATRDAIDPGLFFSFFSVLRSRNFFCFQQHCWFSPVVQQKERPQPPAIGLLSFYWPSGFFQFCNKRKGMVLYHIQRCAMPLAEAWHPMMSNKFCCLQFISLFVNFSNHYATRAKFTSRFWGGAAVWLLFIILHFFTFYIFTFNSDLANVLIWCTAHSHVVAVSRSAPGNTGLAAGWLFLIFISTCW